MLFVDDGGGEEGVGEVVAGQRSIVAATMAEVKFGAEIHLGFA